MTGLSEKINDKSIGEGDIFPSEAGDPFDLTCPERPFLIKKFSYLHRGNLQKGFQIFHICHL